MGQQAYYGDVLTAPVRWSSCLAPQVHAERLRGAWERLVVPCGAEMSAATVLGARFWVVSRESAQQRGRWRDKATGCGLEHAPRYRNGLA